MTHATPESGKGRQLADLLYEILRGTDLKENIMLLIKTDGTNSMTGCNKGFIRYLQFNLRRALQWDYISLLHLSYHRCM